MKIREDEEKPGCLLTGTLPFILLALLITARRKDSRP